MKKNHSYRDESMWKGASPNTFANAKTLRGNMTKAESLLWEKLKDNQVHNLKFRRQHPIGPYVVDFYCHKIKLVLEIDGGYHSTLEQRQYDLEREGILKFNDLKVVRFTNEQIESELDLVLEKLDRLIVEIE